MNSIVVMLIGIFFLGAVYRLYGAFLGKKIFSLDNSAVTPSHEKEDGKDFVPTSLEVLFAHHYTSIAGTGPIVGPAIGIIWGWLPALIWILLGSAFLGAIHDFGALVVSMRNKGEGIGEVASRLISPRVRTMFLSIIILALLIVIAIFCLVISVLFKMYPQAVFSIWMEIPIAIWLGHMIYKGKRSPLKYSIIALIGLYITIWIGAQPIVYENISKYVTLFSSSLNISPIVFWSLVLLIYAWIASSLPVWKLLQPRDYINGHELFIVMILLVAGVCVARPEMVAPVINLKAEGAPPMWPFLFITIACGAISGFHSLVGSGTTAKQLSKEGHALQIGFGGMLLESFLALLAIIAVGAALGMNSGDLTGSQVFLKHYSSWAAASGLGPKVKAFVEGSANLLAALGISRDIAISLMGVFIASFAGTTLDTATRLQRYSLGEMGGAIGIPSLKKPWIGAFIAVLTGGLLALWDGQGKGGLLLWPLFGASNQLLASLALLVVTVYLSKQKKPIGYTLVPFLFMVLMTGWAMGGQVFRFLGEGKVHLFIIGGIILFLEAWMLIEGAKALTQSPIRWWRPEA